MRRQICWIGMLLLLFAFFFFAPFPGGTMMEGFSGLAIKIFLGYCAIILVVQVYSALEALRQLLNDYPGKKKESRRQNFR
jgi:uncharacterized membrane protein